MLAQGEERYFVSMLGEQANWVRNLRTEQVLLENFPVEERAALLKAYLKIAPGTRRYISVDKDAPLEELVKVAEAYQLSRKILDERHHLDGWLCPSACCERAFAIFPWRDPHPLLE